MRITWLHGWMLYVTDLPPSARLLALADRPRGYNKMFAGGVEVRRSVDVGMHRGPTIRVQRQCGFREGGRDATIESDLDRLINTELGRDTNMHLYAVAQRLCFVPVS